MKERLEEMMLNPLEALIKTYWDTIKHTRQSKRISESVKKKEREYWNQYDDELVTEALEIHINRYPNYKESYTRGILRNLKMNKKAGGTSAGKNQKDQGAASDFERALGSGQWS